MSAVSEVVTLVSDVMSGILTKEPMNYFIAMGLVGGALSLFSRARRSAGSR